MDKARNNEEKPVYYKINLWSILAIIGLNVIIAGIILIILSRILFRGVLDDYTIFIYILSDYIYLKIGFSFEKSFLLFSFIILTNYQDFTSTLIYIGIILCASGLGICIVGFIKDYKMSQQRA